MEDIKNKFRFSPSLKYNELERQNGGSKFPSKRIPGLSNYLKEHFAYWWGILIPTLLITLYFMFSVGLVLYQEWFIVSWGVPYPLGLVACYMFVKFLVCALVRRTLENSDESRRVSLSFQDMILSVGPPGIASGFAIGFLYRASQLTTISLFKMITSSTVVFTLILVLVLKLERKSWRLVGTIVLIFGGQVAFFYKSTDVHVLGFIFALLGSFASSLRWTLPQLLMQKSKYGLSNPIDVMYYMQPWMLLSIIPVVFSFEGTEIYNQISGMDWSIHDLNFIMIVIASGILAFCLELTELMIVSRTSSLTLYIAGLLKWMFILIQFFQWSGYESMISDVNFLGLQTCFAGIVLHAILKLWTTKGEEIEELRSVSKSVSEKEAILDKTRI